MKELIEHQFETAPTWGCRVSLCVILCPEPSNTGQTTKRISGLYKGHKTYPVNKYPLKKTTKTRPTVSSNGRADHEKPRGRVLDSSSETRPIVSRVFLPEAKSEIALKARDHRQRPTQGHAVTPSQTLRVHQTRAFGRQPHPNIIHCRPQKWGFHPHSSLEKNSKPDTAYLGSAPRRILLVHRSATT